MAAVNTLRAPALVAAAGAPGKERCQVLRRPSWVFPAKGQVDAQEESLQ